MEERFPIVVMGKQIGTATGYDTDHHTDMLYDFRPSFEVTMPIGDVSFDYVAGTIVKYDDEGNEVERCDLLPIVNSAPGA